MAGLVIHDLGGGDHHFAVVDDALWDQIVDVNLKGEISFEHKEVLGWLACDDPGCDRPEGAPDRAGVVLKSFCTQTWVAEAVDIPSLRGVLTLP